MVEKILSHENYMKWVILGVNQYVFLYPNLTRRLEGHRTTGIRSALTLPADQWGDALKNLPKSEHTLTSEVRGVS
jgi:hypothetical protein